MGLWQSSTQDPPTSGVYPVHSQIWSLSVLVFTRFPAPKSNHIRNILLTVNFSYQRSIYTPSYYKELYAEKIFCVLFLFSHPNGKA